jgi:AAA+ ATPase superfamily predicted ATPase
MKYILMLALIGVIMAVARGLCKQYRDRYSIFEALNDFFRQMRLNLGFQKQKIKQILNQATIKKTNKDIYIAYLNYLDKGQALDLSFVRVLDELEQQQITNMLLSLGKNDTAGELKQLDAYDIYLQDKISVTKSDRDKYCPLITKLSFLFAIGLAILFI